MNNIIIEAISMAPMPGGRYNIVLSDEQVRDLKVILDVVCPKEEYDEVKAAYFLAMNGFVGSDEACEVLWKADHD